MAKRPSLISVRKLAANRFKVQLEESWKHEKPEVREPDKRWYEQIPCRCGGHIMLYGEDPPTLKFYTPSKRKVCRELYRAAIEDGNGGWRIDTCFSGDETVLYFPASKLQEVALLVGAYKRRQVSEETKARLRAQGEAHRWKKGAKGGTEIPTKKA
jgi:hypothetical protein